MRRILGWAVAHWIWSTIILLVTIGVIGAAIDPDTAQEPTQGQSPVESTTTKPPSPQRALTDAITDALGDLNRDGPDRVQRVDYAAGLSVLDVKWAIDDNLTEGYIKDGARLDIIDILHA